MDVLSAIAIVSSTGAFAVVVAVNVAVVVAGLVAADVVAVDVAVLLLLL